MREMRKILFKKTIFYFFFFSKKKIQFSFNSCRIHKFFFACTTFISVQLFTFNDCDDCHLRSATMLLISDIIYNFMGNYIFHAHILKIDCTMHTHTHTLNGTDEKKISSEKPFHNEKKK